MAELVISWGKIVLLALMLISIVIITVGGIFVSKKNYNGVFFLMVGGFVFLISAWVKSAIGDPNKKMFFKEAPTSFFSYKNLKLSPREQAWYDYHKKELYAKQEAAAAYRRYLNAQPSIV